MESVEKIWEQPNQIPDGTFPEMEDFRPIERQILYHRGLRDRKTVLGFLEGEYTDDVDPFLLAGMERAVERTGKSIDLGESITIYGDYDADGVSSAALLWTGLRELGGNVQVYFPDRFTEGYGLNNAAIDKLAAQGTSLIVTVDCGVRAYEQAERAKQLGVDLIITDHHVPGDALPDAFALINPKQPNDSYPFKLLAGVGVAYKFMHALRASRAVPEQGQDLDLVAIGTIADIVPVIGENRVLVRRGLERLNQTDRTGVKKLVEVAGHRLGAVDSTAIGFGLGPRINAAGRLKSARLAFELLVSGDDLEAKQLAEELDVINRERQKLTQEVVDRSFELIERREDEGNIILAFDELFHEGVIGLGASKLVERFYKPTIVGHLQDGLITASARSIPGFHITKALERAEDLMERFGGHAAAAGLRIRERHVGELRQRLEDTFLAQVDSIDLQPRLHIDGIASFEDLDDRMFRFHDKLAPFGAENHYPVLVSKSVRVLNWKTVGSGGRHLKMTLKKDGKPIDAIAFRMGDRTSELGDVIDVAYRFERNEYLGYTTPQLNVQDFKPVG